MSRFTGTFGPSITFADTNAMIEIHTDTPKFVRKQFDRHRLTRLRFQFLENINEQAQPNYEQVAVTGRSEAYMSYAGGSNRVISLDLQFAASVAAGDRGEFDMAQRNVRFLQALTMPTYSDGGIMYPPPLCLLVLGRFIAARGIVTSVTPSYPNVFSGPQSAFDYPIIAEVALEFTCVNNVPLQARDYLRAAAEGGDMEPSLRGGA